MIEFIYFDLGNVLLHFDHKIMVRQLADLFGATEGEMTGWVIAADLQLDYESGRLTSREFYEKLCQLAGSRPDYEQAMHAASAIFAVNEPMIPLLQQLRGDGHRLGILSNTCEAHWQFVIREFPLVPGYFEHAVLSYEVGAVKPWRNIYDRAIQSAGVAPHALFFTDDRLENVAGAAACGIDAEHFVSVDKLCHDLSSRGIRIACG